MKYVINTVLSFFTIFIGYIDQLSEDEGSTIFPRKEWNEQGELLAG